MAAIQLDFLDHREQFSRNAAEKAADLIPANLLNPAVPTFELPTPVELVIEQSQQQRKAQFPQQLGASNEFGPQVYQHPMSKELEMAHGTTTLGFIFKHGVLLAVDSRASTGSYIASGSVKKVIKISNYLLGTMAGGAADCSYWERQLALQCRTWELREGKRITVAAASKLLGNTVYAYKDYGLSMGTMVAGWDEATGPALFYVDSDGTRLKGNLFSVGSGSTYAYGILDNEFKYDLSIDEAVELGKRAIYHATHRDAYSGGVINVFVITAEGWRQMYTGDMNDLHYGQYSAEGSEAPISRMAVNEVRKQLQEEVAQDEEAKQQ